MLLTTLLSAGAGLGTFGAAIAIALTVIGASYGIGGIGRSALDGIARQPEASGDLRMTMIIIAALIEGAALFAIVVCGFVLG